jgi:nickel/cobalt transporter (NicO) family protein
MQQLFELQRAIYAQVASYIQQFANGGDVALLFAMLPMGVLFGAAHALTPGHSKSVLASYVMGAPSSATRALAVSLTLSITHVGMSVLIAVFALPLVSKGLTSAGRAPELESISRGLLLLIGLWMLWRAWRGSHQHAHEGKAVGFVAGLIPCPLTLFVMTLAIARGVPAAGLTFAAAMLVGVAITLSSVALIVTVFRAQLARFLHNRPKLFDRLSRGLEAAAGLALLAVAIHELQR